MAAEVMIPVTGENFKKEVLLSPMPVLVDFWAPWCGPCRLISPIVEELAREYQGRIIVCKINVDEEEDLATRYRVMSIPTICMFKNGQVLEKIVGAHGKEEFSAMIERSLL